jgi:hypothetical protein
VVRAFLEVFPGALLLDAHTQQLILVGRRDGGLAFEPARLRAALSASPALARELRWTSLDRAPEWVGLLAATTATLERATAGVEPLRDDRPRLEYESRELVWDRQLPADLFSVADWPVWCPSCAALPADERDELAGYLEVIADYYRSPAFLREGRSSWLRAPPLSERAALAAVRSVYLQALLGTLPARRRDALVAVRHARPELAARLLEPLAQRSPADAKLQSDFAAALALAARPAEAGRALAAARAAAPDDQIWREHPADLDGVR